MTEPQIDLELAHVELDRKLRDGKREEFSDPDYEDWDKEVDEIDNKLSYELARARPPALTAGDEDDWEDAEIDDL